MRQASPFAVVMTVLTIACRCDAAPADPSPSPSPRPATSAPTAVPAPGGIEMHGALKAVFLTQASSGPGLQPVEGPGFAQGAPAAPVSPYDPFSAAPLVPGIVQQNQLTLDAVWRGRDYSIGMSAGIETVAGDRTNAAYWVEPLLPQDNPHSGSPAIRYSIVFPTRPGTDDQYGAGFGVMQARASLLRDALLVRGGWFDLQQTLGCVFTPPVTTNALPLLGLKTPESLNPGSPQLDAWQAPASTLPLHGVDLVYRLGGLTAEGTDAALPSLPGTPARVESISIGRFDEAGLGGMVQWEHTHTGGDPISTSTGFGAPAQIAATDQGALSVSTLNGQRETIAGGKAVFAVVSGLTATAEYAHSSYSADGLGKPGAVDGSFVHIGVDRALGHATVGAHFYRFAPTFATIVLPYGVPENVWSVAYSWPGPWLKSDYQLVDSSTLGVNREGPLFSYRRDMERSKTDVTYSEFRQIVPYTTANWGDLGFIDGFFLVQRDPAAATIGRFRRTNAFLSRRVGTEDLAVDFVDDGLHRDANAGAPLDAVSYDAPQYVLSLSRHASSRMATSAGIAYYGMRGSWADGPATNVDFGMHVAFVGAQIAERGAAAFMLSLRRSDFRGATYFGALGALQYGSPDFAATTLLVEQRFGF